MRDCVQHFRGDASPSHRDVVALTTRTDAVADSEPSDGGTTA
ncbi:MAG: hypothetical protein ACYC7F_00415 [Gemmatimonadaceae bacterium]